MVVVGDTDTWSLGWNCCEIPLMVTYCALLVDHCSVELCPGAIEGGVDVNVVKVGAGAVTVTVTDWVTVPPVPMAVATYVCVVLATMVVVPESAIPLSSSAWMLGVTLKVVAFVVDQVKATSEPTVTEAGVAVKLSVGRTGDGPTRVTITDFCVLPPAPVATAV